MVAAVVRQQYLFFDLKENEIHAVGLLRNHCMQHPAAMTTLAIQFNFTPLLLLLYCYDVTSLVVQCCVCIVTRT